MKPRSDREIISLRNIVPKELEKIYQKVNQINHKKEFIPQCHSVAGSRIRSYELINSHKIDDSPMLRRMLEDCGSNDTIYDIGANIGTYTLTLAQMSSRGNGQIIAFEPIPKTFERLRTNVKAEGVEESVHTLNMAASDENCTKEIYVNQADRLSTVSPERADNKGISNKININAVIIDGLDIPDPTVMKIDTEGHELNVLRGSTKILERSSPTIYIEPHKKGGYSRSELIDFLTERSYKIEQHSSYWIANSN